MPKVRSGKHKKRRFHGNRHSISKVTIDDRVITASSTKLKAASNMKEVVAEKVEELTGNRIFDICTLVNIISILCCPVCFQSGLDLREDSKFGICSNFCIVCTKCQFMHGFSSTTKNNNKNHLNSLLVMGLRLIGKGYTSGKKLLLSLNLPFMSKASFSHHESNLLKAVQAVSDQNMIEASIEVKNMKKNTDCGVSVDGTWQRRGHSSLNGCVSAISIDTGKILDVEVMSQYCRTCEMNVEKNHLCSNHKGSAGSMEVVGAYRIFERSVKNRELRYTEYYGDGDSKGYMAVKNIYGNDSVKKLECIGHVQKRVGARLRNLKKTNKGLGGKGKLTDKLIDKLQNYYGIAIRSNTGNLELMQSSVIAAFFHCCSSRKKEMHGQCPKGSDSWCKYQRALQLGCQIPDESSGLPESIINQIKSTYMSLCDRTLLSKCLHGMTQNNNESFNNVLWTIVPKGTFVGLQTLSLGAYIAVLLFNSGYLGLLPVFKELGIELEPEAVTNYWKIDNARVTQSKRRSLPATKLARKKNKLARKSKTLKCAVKEGLSYKCGEF